MSNEPIQDTAVQEPANAPGRAEIPVEGRSAADTVSGTTDFLAWGARTDVGLVRGHNEDSFLVRAPLFAVSDGMGGHAAGEVASSIAVETLAEKAPLTVDDVLLGAAVEAANAAVIQGAANGAGKPGMGCTATTAFVEGDRMAIAHVGDSRAYLLRSGTLVRVTHDHSYVEELVDAGQITADEARVHPARSVITRALGSDPDMYADHFTLGVNTGDRIILCSDGLSGMITDSEIERVAISSVTPQQAADNLVSAALTAGGSDNVTVVVVDVLNDGVADAEKRKLLRRILYSLATLVVVAVVAFAAVVAFVNTEWYLGDNDGYVGIYHGVNETVLGIPLSSLAGTSTVAVDDLPEAVQEQLLGGVRVEGEDEARQVIDSYRTQIEEEKAAAEATAEAAGSEGDTSVEAGDDGSTNADDKDTSTVPGDDDTSTTTDTSSSDDDTTSDFYQTFDWVAGGE